MKATKGIARIKLNNKPVMREPTGNISLLISSENFYLESEERDPKRRSAASSKKRAKVQEVEETIVKKVKKGSKKSEAASEMSKVDDTSGKTQANFEDNGTKTVISTTVTTTLQTKKKKNNSGDHLLTKVVQSIGTVNKTTPKRPALDRSFYKQDIVKLSEALLGKYFVREYDGKRIQCKIIETEAYGGKTDKACHAYQGKVTEKNKWMYREGGHLYVYSIYGNNYCLNVTSNEADDPAAVLIRGVEPIEGLEHIKENRKVKNLSKSGKELCNGPGKAGQALNLDKAWNANDLTIDDGLYISEGNGEPFDVVVSKRINIDYSGEDKDNPWRFYIKGNPFVSVK